jgi:hypothetical protein
MWFLRPAVSAAVEANYLSAVTDKKVDPAWQSPVALETRRETVHEHNGRPITPHLVVDAHAHGLNVRHPGMVPVYAERPQVSEAWRATLQAEDAQLPSLAT